MLDFFRAGGFSMWIVLALGGAAAAAAFALLRAPEPSRLGTVRALTWACTFAIVAGLGSNLIAVFHHVAHQPDVDPGLVFQGLAEALSPAVLGGTLLSVAWLVVAVAVRRGGAES